MGGKVRKRERGEEEEGRERAEKEGEGRKETGREGDADVMLYSVKGALTFAEGRRLLGNTVYHHRKAASP